MFISILGWFGSFTGLFGSLLLALNESYSGYGFVVFLFSNSAWFIHGLKTKVYSMVMMQVGFMATSIVGIIHWFF